MKHQRCKPSALLASYKASLSSINITQAMKMVDVVRAVFIREEAKHARATHQYIISTQSSY